MNIPSFNNYNLTSDRNTAMSFNLVNSESESPTVTNQRQSVFGSPAYKPIEWSQVTPQQMPWAQNPSQYSQVMTFGSPNFFSPQTSSTGQNFNASVNNQQPNGFQLSASTSSSHRANVFEPSANSLDKRKPFVGYQSQFSGIHCKRKSEITSLAPSKQHITEERMAAHMSKLHISSETPLAVEVGTSQEESTAREKRLVMCEEMRRLQTESIIPSALMKRLERPCMAVMLWQPPEKGGLIPSLTSYTNGLPSTSSGTTSSDNNNTSSINLNRSSSTDDTDEDEPNSVDNMDMEL